MIVEHCFHARVTSAGVKKNERKKTRARETTMTTRRRVRSGIFEKIKIKKPCVRETNGNDVVAVAHDKTCRPLAVNHAGVAR